MSDETLGRLERVLAGLKPKRKKRENHRPVDLELHFLMHADGSIYQHWPHAKDPQIRKVTNPLLIELVRAEYARYQAKYRQHLNQNAE